MDATTREKVESFDSSQVTDFNQRLAAVFALLWPNGIPPHDYGRVVRVVEIARDALAAHPSGPSVPDKARAI
jgi:hypothetical protein